MERWGILLGGLLSFSESVGLCFFGQIWGRFSHYFRPTLFFFSYNESGLSLYSFKSLRFCSCFLNHSPSVIQIRWFFFLLFKLQVTDSFLCPLHSTAESIAKFLYFLVLKFSFSSSIFYFFAEPFFHFCYNCSLKHFITAALKSLSDNSNICVNLADVCGLSFLISVEMVLVIGQVILYCSLDILGSMY